MATVWEPTRVKAQLRLTAQRLGQSQYKMDSQGQVTRRDISILLSQGNIALARAKAQKLIRDDKYADLLQALEMQVGVVLEHMHEFEHSSPGPLILEATSTIIYAASRTDSRDVHTIRDLLVARLGSDFARSSVENRDNYVSHRVVQILGAPAPSAAWLNQYLYNIAKAHSVDWHPGLQPHEKVNAISEMLDPSSAPEVDMDRLRQLCAQAYKRSREARKQRDNYYDLVRRLLEPFDSVPPPTTPLHPTDASLVNASNDLSNVPSGLLANLDEEPEASSICPLDPVAPEDIKIACAGALDDRLLLIKGAESPDLETADDATPEIRLEGTPEIRLEGADDVPSESSIPQLRLETSGSSSPDGDHLNPSTPEISLSAPDTPTSTHSVLTTLLPSKAYTVAANRAPQVAALLVPIYTALADEADSDDLAHIEADAFWLFEVVVSEFADLEDPELSTGWLQKLGDRLGWADVELAENLRSKGLDPALPHYSYRWLTPVLTHTLPLPAVLTVWDALFSQPMRERDSNPKVEFLLDVCTSMLLCARDSLTRLGKRGKIAANLWGDENAIVPSSASSALAARELEDAFAEGMELLRDYPVARAGGIDAILQLAHALAVRRQSESQASEQAATTTIGARLRNTMWGFTSQPSIKEVQEDEGTEGSTTDDDDDQPLRPAQPTNGAQDQKLTISSRLASTVWKGITNQTAMEAPPSPVSPVPPTKTLSPLANPPVNAHDEYLAPPSARASKIWGYAEKLRDSDTAATLAKVSTNWRFKALDAWNNRAAVASSLPALRSAPLPPPKTHLRPESLTMNLPTRSYDDSRRSSVPDMDRSDVYSPPTRPAFFRPVRDSYMPPEHRPVVSPSASDAISPVSDNGSDGSSSKRLSRSLAHLGEHVISPQSSTTMSGGPRPLLLNSSSLITTGHARSPTQPPVLAERARDSFQAKRPIPQHRHSQSSVSSLSPDNIGTPRRAETIAAPVPGTNGIPSRIVPLNRKTPSPMARHAKRTDSVSSTPSSPPTLTHSRLPTDSSEASARPSRRVSGWAQADSVDSSTTLPSPPLPRTPSSIIDDTVRVEATEHQRGSVVLTDTADLTDVPTEGTHMPRKPSLSRLNVDDTSDSSVAPVITPIRSSRVRSKRFPTRLNSIRIKETKAQPIPAVPSVADNKVPSPNNLAAPELSNDDAEVSTPRAATFDSVVGADAPFPSRRSRKISGERSGDERRPRKLSGDGRARKVSGERSRKVSTDGGQTRHKRESAAVEGDDEGYDELLSAYESEDSAAR
ncbi:hypothetical protein EUX98_g4555 [Antrodiella citrinella]|uniref:Rab-GAP TBC domain-containing protein n=1 Tax=Antrodiella citrinella TaxID=2447956 RepID=A0A4S4MWG8_9APHY|nr:hypothetical protein EUX98_g4555 [Antrodiella citrinella]